jgi:hypothetical protein
MLSDESKRVAAKAKKLFQEKYREKLEKCNCGEFVCIEPESGDFFLGQTFDDAVNKAIDAYPGRLTHTLRVGHDSALHLGVMMQ